MNKEYRSAGRVKKYGVCLNEKCEQYKQVQEILHGEMVCPACGQKLSPCGPPKKKKNYKPLLFGVAGVLVVAIVVCLIALSGVETEEPETPILTDSVSVDTITITHTETRVDTVKIERTVEKETTPTTQETTTTTTVTTKTTGNTTGSGTLKLSYGQYTGAIRNGYPHGQGRLTYTTTRQINRNDVKGRTANAGEYIIGEFFNGFVVYGKHYDAEGNLLGSLNFGVGSEDSYESK
jgi:hypothetical protein